MGGENWQARTELLLGAGTSAFLAQAHVAVIGLGGVGGIAAEMIARAGVGAITIVDGDKVDATNRNRQIAALTSTVGCTKVEVIAERLRDINPDIKLRAVAEYLEPEMIPGFLESLQPCGCILDAIDTIAPKTALTIYAITHQMPIIGCMGAGAKQDPEKIRCADISKTTHCSLARVMRHKLREAGITRGYPVIFSEEQPDAAAVVEEVDPAVRHKRSVTGTVSYMPAIFGCHCAAAVIRTLLKNKQMN